MQFTVTRGDHDHNHACSTRKFAVQVSSNTQDFQKYLTGVTKYTRVVHSHVCLNRAVPYNCMYNVIQVVKYRLFKDNIALACILLVSELIYSIELGD